jgi:hypothetical protein
MAKKSNYSNIINMINMAAKAPTALARVSLLQTAEALLRHELALAKVDAKKEP